MDNKKRNLGIDLLKIAAMFLIVCEHIFSHGGLLAQAAENNSKYLYISSLYILFRPAVNCYALITGWGSYKDENCIQRLKDPKRYRNYFLYWVQVVFIGLLFTGILAVTKGTVSKNTIIQYLLPVTHKAYWYFTAYTVTFLIAPILNTIIARMDKKLEISAIIVVVLFGVIATSFKDGSLPAKASRVVWIVFLYCIGALIKKHGTCFSAPKASGLICLAYLVSIMGTAYADGYLRAVVPNYENSCFSDFFSPVILVISVLAINLFAGLKIARGQKAIKTLSTATFGIYLVHEHKAFRQLFIDDHFRWICDLHWIWIFLAVVGSAAVIFCVSFAVEYGRARLFKMIGLK